MATRLLRTEWPPTDLKPGNVRFDAVFASLRDEGQREPLTINLRWFLIDGNHRLAAARLLGMDYVEVRVWTGTEYVA